MYMLMAAAINLTAAFLPAHDCPGVARQAYALAEYLDAGHRVDVATFAGDRWLPLIVQRWQTHGGDPVAIAEWAHGRCLARVGVSGGTRLAGD